jgi:DNA-binding PadR family transcriptional regulator
MRRSLHAALVLQHFFAQPEREWHGYDLMQATGLKSGSLYPILTRLTAEGWVLRVRRFGSQRVVYQLTEEGQLAGGRYLASMSEQFSTRRTP